MDDIAIDLGNKRSTLTAEREGPSSKGGTRSAGGGEADPPLLIGGLRQGATKSLHGVRVDYFTATVSTEVAADQLLTTTRLFEPGFAKQGFAKSELRECLGGRVWRRWQPIQASVEHGLGYESWEWSGGGSEFGADHLRLVPGVRPSRVDVAFDFECDEAMTPEELCDLPAVKAHCKRRKIISDGITGSDGVFTRYIGGAESERRMRVYRKDRQSAVLAAMVGPLLRVELILRGDLARSWWAAWTQDKRAAYTRAANELYRLSGVRVALDGPTLPEVIYPQREAAERLLSLVEQNAAAIVAAERAGIDLLGLCRLKVEAMSRASCYRFERTCREMAAQSPDESFRMVAAVIAAASSSRKPLDLCDGEDHRATVDLGTVAAGEDHRAGNGLHRRQSRSA